MKSSKSELIINELYTEAGVTNGCKPGPLRTSWGMNPHLNRVVKPKKPKEMFALDNIETNNTICVCTPESLRAAVLDLRERGYDFLVRPYVENEEWSQDYPCDLKAPK